MSPYNVIRIIVVVTAIVLVGLFLGATRFWPQIAGHNNSYFAIAVPIIGGLAILAPLVVKSVLKR